MEVRAEDLNDVYNSVGTKEFHFKSLWLPAFITGLVIPLVPVVQTYIHELMHWIIALITFMRPEEMVVNIYTGHVGIGSQGIPVISKLLTFTAPLWAVPFFAALINKIARRVKVLPLFITGIATTYQITLFFVPKYAGDLAMIGYDATVFYLLMGIIGNILMLITLLGVMNYGNERHGMGTTPNGPGRRFK